MELIEYVALRRPKWVQLERLLDLAERDGLKKLSLEDARTLSKLYRSASSDLLWVRSRAGAADVSGYLNDLVGRAYALTYPGKKVRLKDITRFLTHGFPDLMSAEWRAVVASFLVFWGGFGFGWVGMMFDPEAAPYLVPEQHLKMDPVKRAAEEAKSEGASTGSQAAFASFLFTHNIQVAFLAFALGITAGIGTVIMLFANGVLLGALAWVYASKGMLGWFWAWILPHGIPEITAICIAGAAGFLLARGLVAPKGLARRVALRREAITAVKLLLGTLALFVLAGLIEGSISQIHPPRLSITFKITFALLVGAGVYAYLWSALLRRGAIEAAESPSALTP
ncbi:MAG: stage II sporulation protein M [Myxococcales bacterium]|nr:stage II sporulation protein M [Myxococcales bacterium]